MLAASKLPLDEELPHLATIASEPAMAALFAAHLAPGWELLRCRIKEPRYYPGLACLLSYHLRLKDASGEEAVLALNGRAFGREPVPEPFRSRPPLATAVGSLPSYLPQLGLALWTFPDDPGIPGLADVWRRGGVLFDRPGVLVHVPWPGRRPGLETALVGYVPTKRCIVRYDRHDHALPEPFYGKVYGAEDASHLFAQMQALWSYSQREAPELALARPLGCNARLNALWQSSPGGEPLLEVLATVDLEATMRRVAAALAAVHRAGLRPVRIWRIQEETIKLERARAVLGRFYPALGRQIDTVLGGLEAAAPAEAARLVPVHGDFHCNQILVRDDRVAIIDFDLFGMGDPLHDVARFISRFRGYAHGKLPETQVQHAQASFLSTYEILAPWRVERRRLRWLIAALLINRQALKMVKRLSGESPEPVAALLETAARIAAGQELQ